MYHLYTLIHQQSSSFLACNSRLRSATRRHHPPQRAVLSQICCFGERKMVMFQIQQWWRQNFTNQNYNYFIVLVNIITLVNMIIIRSFLLTKQKCWQQTIHWMHINCRFFSVILKAKDCKNSTFKSKTLRAHCTDLTKWLTIWLSIDPLQEALTID